MCAGGVRRGRVPGRCRVVEENGAGAEERETLKLAAVSFLFFLSLNSPPAPASI